MIYNISYKTLICANPYRIRFDKVGGFIRVYDGTRYLVLFGLITYPIYNRSKYLITLKSDIAHVFSHNYFKNQNWFISFFTFRKDIDFT